MKKNLVPLLGIALVVAIISTAIFYSLISSQLTGPVEAKTATPAAPADVKGLLAAESAVPKGMRAVSVQVADSTGVLALLKPGHRVDIQAVYNHGGSPVESELKTVLNNIEVLSVNPQPEAWPGRHTLPVVTFLADPAEADVLALADSAARLRIALRHPEDIEDGARDNLAMHQLVRPRRTGSRRAASRTSLSLVNPPPAGACLPQASPLSSVPQ
jgi:Flp pilus assembly protein CpaB